MAGGRRAEQQRINCGKIISAARDEFSEVGYRNSKIDRIAERAHLTRGAVYSNFSGKRALGLTVAAGLFSEREGGAVDGGVSREDAVEALARGWLARLPVGGSGEGSGLDHLVVDLHAEVREDRDLRDAHAQLLALDAVVLARALEWLGGDGVGRQVRAASSLLALLYAASSLSAVAPGFTDPFDIVTASRALVTSDFSDAWFPPHESIVSAVHPEDRPWALPVGSADVIGGEPANAHAEGIVAVLGLRQSAVVEQAVRAARPGSPVTVVLVTDDPAERMPLAEVVLAQLLGVLRPVVPTGALAGLSVILDRDGSIADAAGLRSVNDDTQVAFGVVGGRITARAVGPGACHALGAATERSTASIPRTVGHE